MKEKVKQNKKTNTFVANLSRLFRALFVTFLHNY